MHEGKSSRAIVARFRKGDDVLDRLTHVVSENGVVAGSFTGIGSVVKAEVGFYVGNGQYSNISLRGPLEVLSCVGNVSLRQGLPFVHAHISLSDSQGRACGGHLMPGCIVDPTFEVFLQSYEGIDLVRKQDPETKLFLLDT